MPSKKAMGILVSGLLFTLAVGALAFAKNTCKLKVQYDAFVNGKQLKEGQYNLQWESGSPQVTVTFSRGKSVVATAVGRWEERDVDSPTNTILYDTNSDGSRTILEIRLAGSKQVIMFGDAASTTQTAE